MISEYIKNDSSKILYVINDAAAKYKGIIPNNCWSVPYMSEQKLFDEFFNGVRMFGYNRNNKLIGVIGIQEIKDKELYAYNVYQIEGEGRSLFSKIEGDEDTIMGLPVKQIKAYLNAL